jgi:hypothetical protein
MCSGGRTAGAPNPALGNVWSQRPSRRSVVGRPGTCLPGRALTRASAPPRAARRCNRGIPYPPVDAITRVVMGQAVHPSARRCQAQGNALKVWTGWASRAAGTQTQGASAPTSLPAAGGWLRGRSLGVGWFCWPFWALGVSGRVQGRERKGRQDAVGEGDHRRRRAASGESVASCENQGAALEGR